MALIDSFLKKKDKVDLKQPRTLLIDKYTSRKEVSFKVEPEKKPLSLLDRAKGFGVGVGKLAVSTGVVVANVLSGTLDFAADFLSNQISKQIKKPVLGITGVTKPTQSQKNLATKWKNFYATTGGEVTEKLKSFTKDLRKIEFIQPSERWQKLPTKEKFSPKNLPETVLNLGPSLISSFGLYAINIPLGITTTVGSVADDIKTIAIESGMDEEKAENLALTTGFAVVALDKIVPSKLFSPGQKEAFIGGFLKRVVKSGLLETVTEIAQENIQLSVESTIREDLRVDEIVFRNLMAGLGGLLGGVGAQTMVSFVNGIKSGDISGIEDEVPVVEVPIAPEVEPKKAPTQEIVKTIVKEKVKGKKPTDVKTKTKEAVISQVKEVKIVAEKSVDNVKNIKDVKTTLKTIRQNFEDLTLQVEGQAIIAQEQREGLNVKDINQLKRTVARSKKFQEGDIETIRSSNTGSLLNRVIENIQEKTPNMSEAEAFNFALDLPTQETAQRRTTAEIRELSKKEKSLSKFLKTLRSKQKDLDIQQDDSLFKQWQEVLDSQEKLVKLIRVPARQLPVGEGKEKVSRLQARLKGELDKTSQEDIEKLGQTTFRQSVNDEQISKSLEYVRSNPEEALRVVLGEIDPPKGVLQNSVYSAIVQLGTEDTDLATKVASLGATKFGQEIQILKTILADNPVVMMQDIVKIRIEAYEKRTGKTAKQRIKTEVNRIGSKIEVPNSKNWDNFLNSIKC